MSQITVFPFQKRLLAIAIGAMVDAAVVMIENAHKKLEAWRHAHPGEKLEGDQTENADATENAEKKDSKATWKSGRKLKFTWQEQKDYETIEDDIAALEAKLEELDEKMGSFASDFVKLNELTQEKIKVEDELEHKMERWEYLEELNARIKAQDR